MRQSEHDMEVRARQQAYELGIDPGGTSHRGAARAAAMPAGVELFVAEVTLRADESVAAASGRVAAANALRGLPLARMQRALLRVGIEVRGEDVLQRAAHGGPGQGQGQGQVNATYGSAGNRQTDCAAQHAGALAPSKP